MLGAGLAVAAYLGRATPWVVILFTFLEGIVWALNGPTIMATVSTLVPRSELDKALALNSVQFNMARSLRADGGRWSHQRDWSCGSVYV
jgi:MFS family permease